MSDETAPLSAVRVEPVVMPLTDGQLQIIYEHGLPHGIRDRRGFLFFFTPVQKFSNQEERYRQEVEHKFRLADFLLLALQGHNAKVTGSPALSASPCGLPGSAAGDNEAP